MNLFGVLGNARGQRSLASRVLPRRPVKRLPAERLAAARLLGVLNLLDDATAPAGSRQLDGADPQHESAARQPRHARELLAAPSGTDPEVLVPEVLVPEVLVPEVPAVGRHRRTGVHAAESADEIPAAAIQGAGRHRRPGLPAAADLTDPSKAPGSSTSVVPLSLIHI